MARKLSTTHPDIFSEKDPYILTKEEEDSIVKNLISEEKKFLKWKMTNNGMSEQQADNALANKGDAYWSKKINKELAFERVNSSKHYATWLEAKRRNDKEEKEKKAEEESKRCTYKYFYQLMAFVSKNDYGKDLIFDNQTGLLIKTVCFYLSNDHRFETELGFSFKKGLLFRGVSGLGKTHIVKCVQYNEFKPIQILSMLDITETVKREGEVCIDTTGHLYLDDVGTESPEVNHFGTKINFFKNFIEKYYMSNKSYNRLIISTNCDFDTLEDKYGFRVRSRIREMFNVIYLEGSDMRK